MDKGVNKMARVVAFSALAVVAVACSARNIQPQPSGEATPRKMIAGDGLPVVPSATTAPLPKPTLPEPTPPPEEAQQPEYEIESLGAFLLIDPQGQIVFRSYYPLPQERIELLFTLAASNSDSSKKGATE